MAYWPGGMDKKAFPLAMLALSTVKIVLGFRSNAIRFSSIHHLLRRFFGERMLLFLPYVSS